MTLAILPQYNSIAPTPVYVTVHLYLPLHQTAPRPLPDGAQSVRLRGSTMGTHWQIDALIPPSLDSDVLEQAALDILRDVNAQMSHWDPDSVLSRFNRAAAGTRVTIPDGFYTVLDYALSLAQQSEGALNPAAGKLIDLWGFGPQGRRTEAPVQTSVQACLDAQDFRGLQPDRVTKSITQPGGVALDLSALAKGYAVDLLAEMLEQHSIHSYLVEVGGELRGLGIKPDFQPWWVDLEQPAEQADWPLHRFALHGLALATSGQYRQQFRADGQTYGHTIDPRTGWPVSHGTLAVTVCHPQCMVADAMATILLVLPPEQAFQWAEHHQLAALIVHRTSAHAPLTASASTLLRAMAEMP